MSGEQDIQSGFDWNKEDIQAELEKTAQEEDKKFNCKQCPAAPYIIEQIKQDRIRQYQRQREKDQNSLLLMTVILGVPFVYCGIQLYNELSSCF